MILFIDEIHTLLGAGRTSKGALDAANILKPALARGEIRCIGATTGEEYRQYFERDAALARRFQPIHVFEPSAAETMEMLVESYVPRLSNRHGVQIDDAAIEAAVRLSIRYLPDRRLPDKAVDLLDEACARVANPMLSARPGPGRVSTADVTRAVAQWARIPVGDLEDNERNRLLGMADHLRARIVGQDHACARIAAAVQRGRVGIRESGRPAGVFLFVGPTGVGKTELAKATAEFLFGTARALTRLDMSEYAEPHSMARLVGAPPGYVGHEDEGILTGALRRTPRSIVLLDEVDKAHPEVLRVFLQLFDEGRLTDASGRTADGSNALFIMTANGKEIEPRAQVGFRTDTEQPAEPASLHEICPSFTPELINRIDEILTFHPLDRESTREIARRMLDSLSSRLRPQGIRLQVDDSALDVLSDRGFDPRYGARPMRRVIEQHVENEIAGKILRDQLRSGHIIQLDAADRELRFSVIGTDTCD